MPSGVTSIPASRCSATRVTSRFSRRWPSSISMQSLLPMAHLPKPMAPRWKRFRSSLSTMTELFANIRVRLTAAVALTLLASAQLGAQQPNVIPLSLGDAGRLAAHQSALAQGARLRADEAQARVRERRADLLPTVNSYVQQAGRTFNTSTLGID